MIVSPSIGVAVQAKVGIFTTDVGPRSRYDWT